MATNSNENEDELQKMLRDLCDSYLDSLEDEMPEDIRVELRFELEKVLSPTKKELPPTEMEQLGERFDAILGSISSYFPNGLPEEVFQSPSNEMAPKEIESLDAFTLNYFKKELTFAEGLRDHPLGLFVNAPATDANNAMPEGRSASLLGKNIQGTTFKYEPLNFSTDASRLVVLHPGNRQDELKCDLITLPFFVLQHPDDKSTETSRYEALSYVWGSADDPVLISIGGQDFQIGRNLYSALVHLRLKDEDRLLWIDAICINQNDISERNWQVSRMGLIYRSALQTVAWLGPATWGSDMICSAILAFQRAQAGEMEILPQEVQNINACLFGLDELSEPAPPVDPSFIQVLWDQLDQLFERPIFTRSWTVQEFVLGRHVTVYCGNMCFPFSTLESAASHSAKVRSSLAINMYTPLKTGAVKFMSFSILRSQLWETDTELPLYHFASRFGRLSATDPRDKIYAILSLSPALTQEGIWHDHGFSPDYAKSTLDVFRDFALFSIKKYNNLDILSRPFRNNEQHPLNYDNWVEDWPSWVPDWERRGIKEIDFGGLDSLGHNPFREFNAAAGWDGVDFVEADSRTIAFLGIEFDKIVDVVEGDIFRDPRHVGGDEDQWAIWEAFAMKIGEIYGQSIESKQVALWKTLVADSDGNGSFAPDEFENMFRAWRSNISPEETGLYKSFIDQLCETTRGRKIFITKRGYLGIGTWQIEIGDTLSILKGGKLPVLGRESGATIVLVSEEEGLEPGAEEGEEVAIYRLVGSGGTYVHGIMDGEAVGLVEEEGLEVGAVFFC